MARALSPARPGPAARPDRDSGQAAGRTGQWPRPAGRTGTVAQRLRCTLAALTGSGTVAVPAGTWRLGQTALVWLSDSAPVRLRVVAVLAHRIDLEQTVLLPWGLRAGHLAAPLATAVYLRMAPGAGLAGCVPRPGPVAAGSRRPRGWWPPRMRRPPGPTPGPWSWYSAWPWSTRS